MAFASRAADALVAFLRSPSSPSSSSLSTTNASVVRLGWTTAVAAAVLSSSAAAVYFLLLRNRNESSRKSSLIAIPIPIPPRIVLITGCDTGFGALLVQQVVNAAPPGGRFHVVAACYTSEGAAQYSDRNDGAPHNNITALVADLLTADGRHAVVQATKAVCHTYQVGLYAIVHNAGIVVPGGVDWLPLSAYEISMELLFHAPVALTYELIPLLRQARGRLIAVTSVDGMLSLPMNAPYCAAKHALEAWCDALRCEWLPWHMPVVIVQPATMRTPLALGFADAFMQTFRRALPDRQAIYGESWIAKQCEGTQHTIEEAAADPMIAANDLVRALLDRHPPSRILSGPLAHYIFYPLSLLPDKWRDRALYRLCLQTNHHRVAALALPTPPLNHVVYLTLYVSNLPASMEFYQTLGFRAVGGTAPNSNNNNNNNNTAAVIDSNSRTSRQQQQQWMRSGGRGSAFDDKATSSQLTNDGPLLLLVQDNDRNNNNKDHTNDNDASAASSNAAESSSPNTKTLRPHWSEIGSTRISLYTPNLEATMECLKIQGGLEPIRPAVTDPRMGRAAVYNDPDGMVVYLIEMYGIPRFYLRAVTWWHGLREPILFHATLNIPDSTQTAQQLAALGFISPIVMERHQVSTKLLEAFDPPSQPKLAIERVNFWLPQDASSIFLLDAIEWDRSDDPIPPATASSSSPPKPHMNHHSMAVAVECVESALARARAAGWTIHRVENGRDSGDNGDNDGSGAEVRLIELPVYGKVRVGSASLQSNGANTFDFVQFPRP